MADKKPSKRDFAAEQAQEMAQGDFSTLLKRFNANSCQDESYAIASWMYARFPNESKALLPLVRDEQLTLDCKSDTTATTGEWASALTAAKWLHGTHPTASALGKVTESQVHDSAAKIYATHHPKADGSPAKPTACTPKR